MQVRTRVSLEKAERRGALVNLFRVREFARVRHALVIVRRERLQADRLRQHKMAGKCKRAGKKEWNERQATAGAKRPGQAGGKPKAQRRSDQIGGREHIHRQKENETTKSGPGEGGENTAAEKTRPPGTASAPRGKSRAASTSAPGLRSGRSR